MSVNTVIFIVVFIAAVTLFISSCYSRFRLVTLGKSDNRSKEIGRRIWNMLYYPFSQRCTINRNYKFGINHAMLFWSYAAAHRKH